MAQALSGSRVKVLVVDDSAVVRRIITQVLATDSGVELVGEACDGRQALEKIAQLKPHIVTLDVEMPLLDGLQTLRALKQRGDPVRVIMFSTLTQRGASLTLDALAAGAADYVGKPESARSLDDAMRAVGAELLPKIRALAARVFAPPAPPAPAPAAARGPGAGPGAAPAPRLPAAPDLPPAGVSKVSLVVIGSSTGGPPVLQEVLKKLPARPVAPVVIVQHMPPVFTKMLAERLGQSCPWPVQEVTDARPLLPGTVYLATGGRHLEVHRQAAGFAARLTDGEPENHCRPAVDVLFRSAAQAGGGGVLALVLTGMGHDGTAGSEAVRRAGGAVLVQDEHSSVVWGMPGNVVRSGLATGVHSISGLTMELASRLGRELAAAGTRRAP